MINSMLYYMFDVDMSGNVRDMFTGGIGHCVELAENYGGAVKLTSLFGVSWMYSTMALRSPREYCCSLFRNSYIYLIHSDCIMFL